MPSATLTAPDATPDPSETGAAARPRLIAPHYLALAGGAQWALDQFLPVAHVLGMPYKMLGWLPILAGLALQLAAYRHFRRHRTPVMPGRVANALVTSGPYRLTRNPMYLGMVLILLGGVVIGGSVSPLLIPPLFIWVTRQQLIRPEEARLTQRFADTYPAYQQRVRRWI